MLEQMNFNSFNQFDAELEMLSQASPRADKNFNPITKGYTKQLSRNYRRESRRNFSSSIFHVLDADEVGTVIEDFVKLSYEIFRIAPKNMTEADVLFILPFMLGSAALDSKRNDDSYIQDVIKLSHELIKMYQKDGYLSDALLEDNFGDALKAIINGENPYDSEGEDFDEDTDEAIQPMFLTEELSAVVKIFTFSKRLDNVDILQDYMIWLTDSPFILQGVQLEDVKSFDFLKQLWRDYYLTLREHDIAFFFYFVGAQKLLDVMARKNLLQFDLPKNYLEIMAETFNSYRTEEDKTSQLEFGVNVKTGNFTYTGPQDIWLVKSKMELEKFTYKSSARADYNETTKQRYIKVLGEFKNYLSQTNLQPEGVEDLSHIISKFILTIYDNYHVSFSQINGSMICEQLRKWYFVKTKKRHDLEEMVVVFGVIPEFFTWMQAQGYLKKASPIVNKMAALKETFGYHRFIYEIPVMSPKSVIHEYDPMEEFIKSIKKKLK
ncbi:MAG: hypothetical protein LBV19_07335 [Streptococcaceae bacterium]|jgi:hypothetical protein|nr:hypothetical protein [Streptococcaceae bacterium]